ncbi:MAG TPA: prolyl oligopeptidase family serine peptidase [Gammaproteobacteria bacterium]
MVGEGTKTRGPLRRFAHAAGGHGGFRSLARRLLRAAAAAACLGAAIGAQAAELPPDVLRLLDAPPLPNLAEGPRHHYALLVHERELVSSEHLAKPVVSVVGLKVDPRTYGRHAPIAYYGLTLVDLATGRQTPLDVPDGAVLGFPMWAADGSHFAFTATVADGIELWVGDPVEGTVRRLVGPTLNGTLSAPCTWMPDNRHVLCRLINGEKRKVVVPTADALFRLTAPTTMQALSQHQALDQWTIRHLIEANLTMIDVETGERRKIGGPAAIEDVEPAPSGAFLLVSRMLPPYPQVSGVTEPLRTVEVWDRFGRVVKTFAAAGTQPNAPRAMQWHASMPATLVWVQRYDGGDRIVMQGAPYIEQPRELFRTQHSYAGLEWLEGTGDVLVSEYDSLRRLRRHWLVPSDGGDPRLVAESSVDAAFSRFGRPMLKINPWGKEVVAVHDNGIFLRGHVATEGGVHAYLDYMRLDTLQTERLWESDGKANEGIVGMLAPDGSVLITRRETSREPPNYFVRSPGGMRALTHYDHPAPGLKDARRIPLRFERPDGLGLSANLYLPAAHESAGPLPLIIWAYPRVYGEDTQAIQPVTAEQFPDFERAFKLFYLLKGYAVLDEVSMPVIGSAATANDTFIEQIVTNAYATIEAAAATGFIDRDRVGVAGHSYGAFMVANLLAHSDLFRAGVALSGAYNRTLTPFGFQTERRSLWEARDTYLAMSPFLYSNRIQEPILLVHGLLDENAGTPPIQSIQFYEAIRHNGGDAEILLLPREGHSYRGRESVLATAAAMLEFFDEHLKGDDVRVPPGTLRASTAATEQVKLAR